MTFFNRLFKFRIFKFRTSLSEELDDLHSEITDLQKTLNQARILQRKWTKWFAIYAILAYLAVNISYYTLFLSRDVANRIYSLTISIALAALLYGIHWTIRWYFRTIIQTKEEKLVLFKERKQELFEEVKTKETYAVAKNLLEKYNEVSTPVINGNHKDVNQRTSIKPTVSAMSLKPSSPVENGHHQQVQTPVRNVPNRLAIGMTPSKLPRAILSPQRTFWGAILDTIVGDGPSKRYALICKSCHGHNGMALEEEFEYLSFHCAHCNYFNGARKHKPVFNPHIFSPPPPPPPSQNGKTNHKPTEMSVTDSSDSTELIPETRVTRRSIRIPATNGNHSSSSSIENKRQLYPTLSSSEESLSDKNK